MGVAGDARGLSTQALASPAVSEAASRVNLISAVYDLDDDALCSLLGRVLSGDRRGLVPTLRSSHTGLPSLDVSRGKFEETPLMVATALRRTEVVRMVMQLVPDDVNARDSSGTSALILAVRTGNAEKVRLLLEAGEPSLVHTLDANGMTTLDHAVAKGHMHLMRILVPAMVQLGQPSFAGSDWLADALLDAIRNGTSTPDGCSLSLALVKEVKNVGPEALSKVLKFPRTLRAVVNAALVACAYDVLSAIVGADGFACSVPTMVVQFTCGCGKGCNEEVVRIVAGLTACVDGGSGGVLQLGRAVAGTELLAAACRREYPNHMVIRSILDIGTLYIGPEAASVSLLELMRSFSRNPTPMLQGMDAARPDSTWTSSNFLKCIDTLLDAGADVTTIDDDGFTAIHYAVLAMNVEVLVFLLSGCLVKVRSMHNARIAERACDAVSPLTQNLQISRYSVDIDRILQLIATDTATLPWRYSPDVDCAGCFECQLEGVIWVLKEWRRGSPPDMKSHIRTMFNNRRPDGTLQFRPCPLENLHASMAITLYHLESESPAPESSATDGSSDVDSDVDSDDSSDDSSDVDHRGSDVENDERGPVARRLWYTSFV